MSAIPIMTGCRVIRWVRGAASVALPADVWARRPRTRSPLAAAATVAWGLLTTAIRECQRAGRIRAGDPEQLGFVLWALIHGLAVLVVDEQLPPAVVRAYPVEHLASHATDVLLAGLGPPHA